MAEAVHLQGQGNVDLPMTLSARFRVNGNVSGIFILEMIT
jgi:hypothetical protein